MRHFPNILSKIETEAQLPRFMRHFDLYRFNYFAVAVLSFREVVGFIGLSHQSYEAPFNPPVDIGWWLRRSVWGKRYATEGARRCLEYAFAILGLKKIGMMRKGEFNHPNLVNQRDFQKCVWHEIMADTQQNRRNLNELE